MDQFIIRYLPGWDQVDNLELFHTAEEPLAQFYG